MLLIVLDGMSWAVCHELLEDIRRDHWFLATLDESAVAAAARHRHDPERDRHSPEPACCRGRSKGAMRRTRSGTSSRTRTWSMCCDKKYPPVLFHKKEVTEGARGAVGDDLGKAILSDESSCRRGGHQRHRRPTRQCPADP